VTCSVFFIGLYLHGSGGERTMPELAGVTQEFTPPLSLKNKPKEKQCPKCARGTMGSV